MIKTALDYYALVTACIISTGTIIGTSIFLIRVALSVSKKLDSLPKIEADIKKIEKEQNEQGVIVRISATQTLLDKTKELESELEISKEREKAINELLHQPLYECDSNGNLFFANDAFVELIGANNVDDLYGHGWMNFIEDPYRLRIETQYNTDIKYNKSFKYKYPIHSEKAQKRYYIDNVGKVFRGVDNKILFILGTIQKSA